MENYKYPKNLSKYAYKFRLYIKEFPKVFCTLYLEITNSIIIEINQINL